MSFAEAPTAGQRRPRFGVLDATPITDDIYVWIVEDDMLVRNALSAHFDALGVRHAFGRDRVELETMAAETGWPDFAVLDDMLGFDETGLDLARWLSPHVSKERILLVTGNTDPMRVKELEGSGFQMMRKPVSSENLKAWLRSGIDGAA